MVILRRMVLTALVGGLAVLALSQMGGGTARSAAPPSAGAPLVLERTIPLPGVKGRIDHLALDPVHERLFVAALGNGSVEVVDLKTGAPAGRIAGLNEPQGVGYLQGADELAVASGGDGTVRFYRGADLAPAGVLVLGSDADNIRIDPVSGRIVVGYGSGALAVIDPASHRVISTVRLPAHPEGFQLAGGRAWVNLPEAGRIAAVDLAGARVTASWPTPGLRFNFPMAFDPARAEVTAVFRVPSRLVVFDAASGTIRQSLDTCADADDLFHDARRHRAYVSCGSGDVEVFDVQRSGYRALGRVSTRPGSRTSLFDPGADRLYVAARAGAFGEAAAILVYRPQP